MLFAIWEVRIAKNIDRGLENIAAFSGPKTQSFPARTDTKPVNNLVVVSFPHLLKSIKCRWAFPRVHREHVTVTVTVVRDWKFQPALRFDKIAVLIFVISAYGKTKTHCDKENKGYLQQYLNRF